MVASSQSGLSHGADRKHVPCSDPVMALVVDGSADADDDNGPGGRICWRAMWSTAWWWNDLAGLTFSAGVNGCRRNLLCVGSRASLPAPSASNRCDNDGYIPLRDSVKA
jgi:hypothetical protein